jgi:tripartite-type tricarboxylate transporter receptor subunit TctC
VRRRRFLKRGSALAAALVAPLAGEARAQTWPSGPVRMLVAFPPGGLTDLFARTLAERLTPLLGQSVYVENKPGAGGILAAEATKLAAPDGQTLFFTLQVTFVQNQALYRKLPYDPDKDFTYLSVLGQGPTVVAVRQTLPVKTLPELVEHARAKPLTWGSWAPGSYGHIVCEAINRRYGLQMQHVVYKGEGPMLQDLASGQIDVALGSVGAMRPYLAGDKLRLIGASGRTRTAYLPDLPTLFEQGATDEAFTITGWIGLVGPAGIPEPVQQRLTQALREAMASKQVRERWAAFAYEPRSSTPQEHLAQYRAEAPSWIRLVRQTGITLD